MNLDPTLGSEIRKTRPCVILSPDEMNRHLNTVIVAPMTTKSKPWPTRMRTRFENRTGWVVIDQIRTVDRRRILRPLGSLSRNEIKRVKSIIKEALVD